jgi:hypothetical protein
MRCQEMRLTKLRARGVRGVGVVAVLSLRSQPTVAVYH